MYFLRNKVVSHFLPFFLLLSMPFSAFAIELSEAQSKALKNAMILGHYTVKVVEKSRGTAAQDVIIVGETHVVNRERHFLAQELVHSFNFVGIEMIDHQDEHVKMLSDDLGFSYKIAGLFKSGAGSYLGPILLAYSRFSEEYAKKLPVEKELYTWLSTFEKNPDEFRQEFQAPVSIDHFIPEFKDFFLSLGFPSDGSIDSHNIDELTSRIRQKLVGDFDLVYLELLDPVPQEFKTWAESFHKAVPVVKASCIALGALAVSTLAQRYLPETLCECINTAAVLTLSTAGTYLSQKLDPVLPECCRIGLDLTGDESERAMIDTRNHVMSKNIEKALILRPYAPTMLVLVGNKHVPGIVKNLTDDFGFHEVSF